VIIKLSVWCELRCCLWWSDDIFPCWPLFLADSFSEEKQLNQQFSRMVHAKIKTRNSEVSQPLLRVTSPLVAALLHEGIQRSHALICIEAVMCSRPLSPWFILKYKSTGNGNGVVEKIVRYVSKVMKLLTMLLIEDVNLHHIKLALRCFSQLLSVLGSAVLNNTLLNSQCDQFLTVLAFASAKLSILNSHLDNNKFNSKAMACLDWLCATSKSVHGPSLHCLLDLSIFLIDDEVSLLFQVWVLDLFSLLAIRRHTFCESLIWLCTNLFVQRQDNWTRQHVLTLASSAADFDRLLSARIIQGEVRNNQLQNCPVMLRQLSDHQHRIRVCALETIANCSQASISLSEWGQARERIFALCMDEKSTVRSAAFKTIGELARSEALQNLDVDEFQHVLKGCQDSSLAVRLQAMWALSKALFRQLLSNSPSIPDSPRRNKLSNYWLQSVEVSLNALKDSDKIHATSLRTLSYAVAGLVDHTWLRSNSVVESTWIDLEINSLRTVWLILMKKYFGHEETTLTVEAIGKVMSDLAQKDLFALVDIFGLVCVSTLESTCNCAVDDVNHLFTLLTTCVRHGQLQTRLAACRIILALLQREVLWSSHGVTLDE
jgi:hypothetical protein